MMIVCLFPPHAAAVCGAVQKVYGDYEILKAIGKGKFAVVYRAKRKSDGEIGMFNWVVCTFQSIMPLLS